MLTDWASVATIMVGVLAGVGLMGLVLKGLKFWITEDTASKSEVREIVKAEVTTQLTAIRKQVTPNGGDTDQLGDRVQRIEESNEQILSLLRRRVTTAKKAPVKKAK